MFWIWRRRTCAYGVTRELAQDWPVLAQQRGMRFDSNRRWAQTWLTFGGIACGELQAGNRRIDVGSEQRSEPHQRGGLPPGYYVRVSYVKRNEPLAKEFEALLLANGATPAG